MLSTLPVRAAVISAVSPSGSALFGFGAGLEQRRHDGRVAVLGRQRESASSRSGSTALTLAPARSSICTVGTSLARTAQCSAVMPSASAALTSACWAMSAFTAAALPCFTASTSRTPLPPAAPRLATADSQQAARHSVRFSCASM